jgi:hypothetical protein
MLSRIARPFAASAIVGLAFSVAACSTTIDMSAVSTSVSDGLNAQLSLPIASVACPTEARSAKAGDTFECIATPKDGGKLTIKVTQDDDKGNIKWEVAKTEGLIDLKIAENSITSGLKEQAGVDATVSCGGKYRAAKAGETFECQAKSPDKGDATIVVTMTNATGDISWAVKQ